MKHFLYIFSITFCIGLFSCSHSPETTAACIPAGKIDSTDRHTSKTIDYDLTYEDTLPCKDCKGIKTTLKFSTRSNKFSLREEFLGTSIAPNMMLGNFNTERGFEKDEDATLYVLNDELPEAEHLYFLRETGKNELLVKLDGRRRKTNHSNFVLTKKQ